MRATKHTPGPWGVEENRGTGESFLIFASSSNGETVLVASIDPNDEDRGDVLASEPEANAKLIAAAPTMADRLGFDNALLERIASFLETADADELLDDVNAAIGHNTVALDAAGRIP